MLQEKPFQTCTRPVRHGRYTVFPMAEAGRPRQVFAGSLGLINGLRGPPSVVTSA